ncbi:MAG TPA: hypothetical protein VIM11_01860 [Tepidisphaeraceae bacterium]|jgi:hypothetical protein
MVYRGHVERGVVVLDDATALADGTPVEVRVGLATTAPIGHKLEQLAGLADLPADIAEKHDQHRRLDRTGS